MIEREQSARAAEATMDDKTADRLAVRANQAQVQQCDWRRTVNQFSVGQDDAYEYRCGHCGRIAWVETGRRGAGPQSLPEGPCPASTT